MRSVARQNSLYQNKGRLWRKSPKTFDADGKPSGDMWALVPPGRVVACLIGNKTGFGQPVAGGGRVEEENRRTNKEIHFVAGTNVQQGDIFQNLTTDTSGQKIDGFYNTFYTLLGLPEDAPILGSRRANFAGFEMQRLEKPPTGVG